MYLCLPCCTGTLNNFGGEEGQGFEACSRKNSCLLLTTVLGNAWQVTQPAFLQGASNFVFLIMCMPDLRLSGLTRRSTKPSAVLRSIGAVLWRSKGLYSASCSEKSEAFNWASRTSVYFDLNLSLPQYAALKWMMLHFSCVERTNSLMPEAPGCWGQRHSKQVLSLEQQRQFT